VCACGGPILPRETLALPIKRATHSSVETSARVLWSHVRGFFTTASYAGLAFGSSGETAMNPHDHRFSPITERSHHLPSFAAERLSGLVCAQLGRHQPRRVHRQSPLPIRLGLSSHPSSHFWFSRSLTTGWGEIPALTSSNVWCPPWTTYRSTQIMITLLIHRDEHVG
jgi:hypothetical protein